jgi:hypothetical protein
MRKVEYENRIQQLQQRIADVLICGIVLVATAKESY